jgi:putative membrane protein
MSELVGLVAGSLVLRPYVFAFLAAYLVSAAGEWGWRRAGAFTGLAAGLAFTAEAASTRIGVPFGLYHYTGVTRGRELYLADVPVFDPLSFAFLAYASLGLARWLRPTGGRLVLASGAGLLMTWLDVVIDPLAVRGDRWFLGRVFYYPEPGWYFGVPAANFAGWAVLGGTIAGTWLALEGRLGGAPPRWAGALPGRRLYPVALYYGVLVFNLAVTAAVAEPALFWLGAAAHAPLAAVVVFFGAIRRRRCRGAPAPPDRTRREGGSRAWPSRSPRCGPSPPTW